MRNVLVRGCAVSLILGGGVLACGDSELASGTPTGGGGEGPTTTTTTSSSGPGSGGSGASGGSGGGQSGTGGATACGGSAPHGLAHVIVVIQENHTFDNYFGSYCTAAPGSNPTCTTGPACCEKAPATEPSGASPKVLNDDQNGNVDPDHHQACEIEEINGGAMDRFVTGASCSSDSNFAVAPASAVQTYRDYATKYAIADRYFQPIAGQSSSNDMYFAVAKEVFIDNQFVPDVDIGCTVGSNKITYTGETTIADLLIAAGKTVKVYAQGFGAMKAAGDGCPPVPADCPLGLPFYPCLYDPSDIPFLYYKQFGNDPDFMQDYADLAQDVASGTLPDVTYVKAIGYHSEHPGYGTDISSGEAFVDGLKQTIDGSCYKDNTLILVTWDEGGGSFDHVAPPPDSAIDHQPYGTRVPLIAIGPLAKKNTVSHVEMEHSSIVKFLEFVYLDGQTGQLGARDTVVNNIGSLLDESATGLVIPD